MSAFSASRVEEICWLVTPTSSDPPGRRRMCPRYGQVDHLQRPGVGGSQRRRPARRRLESLSPTFRTTPQAYGPVVGGRFTLRRAGAPVCDLDAVEVVRRDRRVPNAIPIDGLKINQPVVPKLSITGLSSRARSIEVFVREDHSQAEALAGRVSPSSGSVLCYLRPDSPVKAKVYQRLFWTWCAYLDGSPVSPVGAGRRTPGQCCRDPWRSGAGRLHPR
jgi:hypothetical protein